MSHSWVQVAKSCGEKPEKVIKDAIALLEENGLCKPEDSDGLTPDDVSRLENFPGQKAPVKALVRSMINAVNSGAPIPPSSAAPPTEPLPQLVSLKPDVNRVSDERPMVQAPSAQMMQEESGSSHNRDSFYQVREPRVRAGEEASYPPNIVHSSLTDKASSFQWIPQASIAEWFRAVISNLRSDKVYIAQHDFDRLSDSIMRNPVGLSTVIEWRQGKVQLFTRQRYGQWEVVFRKFTQTAIVASKSHVSTRAERWSNISDLPGWLNRQAEKLKRSVSDFNDDDLAHLEETIRGNPLGVATSIEWTDWKWQLTIKMSGEIWQAISVLEEKKTTVSAPEACVRNSWSTPQSRHTPNEMSGAPSIPLSRQVRVRS